MNRKYESTKSFSNKTPNPLKGQVSVNVGKESLRSKGRNYCIFED